jgi:AcrR family transcriptional regulator
MPVDAGPVSTSREDWIAAGLEVLVADGAAAVKILTLARRLGCSRSNFYWYFRDRDALLDALLQRWQERNTTAIVDRAGLPAARISQAVLNIFDCWADPALFDPRLDFAVREWARGTDQVRQAVREADDRRLQAITDLFLRFGARPAEAAVRTRVLYFTQIGYYALEVRETLAERQVLLRDYVEAFCAEAPAAEDIRAFIRRNPA